MKDQTTTDDHPGSVARVKEKVGDATEHMKESASHLADDARDKGEHLLDLGKEAARSRADMEKHRVASGLRTFADALRHGSQDLGPEQDQFRPLLSGAAERVERFSEMLESRDIDTLTRDARRFANEHQALFAGGAFALGFLGARLLKSSEEGDESRIRRFDRSFDYESEGRYGFTRSDSGPAGESSTGFGRDGGDYDREGGRRGADYE
jgi:hypothetical protein